MGLLDATVSIVVGGHSGFGEAIARTFVREGGAVVVAARRAELVASAAEAIGASGAVVDITDDEQVQALVGSTVERHGRLDAVVNCAGYEQSTLLADLTPEKLKAMHDVALTAALYLMRHACNAMAELGGGAYLSMSSLTARNPAPGMAAYASAKAGVEYATKVAAVEYGRRGVRVNCVAASPIVTPTTARVLADPVAMKALVEMTPLGRLGSPQDVANAALYLCSPLGAYVTGQTLRVDGGASLLALPTLQMYADVAARLQMG